MIVICCSFVDLPTCSLAVELQLETENWRQVRRRIRWSALRYRRLSHSLSLPLTYNNPRPSLHTHICPFTIPLFLPSPSLLICLFPFIAFPVCMLFHLSFSSHLHIPPIFIFPTCFSLTRFQPAQLFVYVSFSFSWYLPGFTSITLISPQFPPPMIRSLFLILQICEHLLKQKFLMQGFAYSSFWGSNFLLVVCYFSWQVLSLIFPLFSPLIPHFPLSFLWPSIRLHHLDPPLFLLSIALCLPADSSLSKSGPIRRRLHSREKDDVIFFSAGGQCWR